MRMLLLTGPLTIVLLGVLGAAAGCRSPEVRPADSDRDVPSARPGPASASPGVELPVPDSKGHVPLETLLASRRSTRHFAPEPLSRAELGQLVWAGQGLSDPSADRRTAPSAGALYPLEMYLAQADGVLHYLPRQHAFERVSERDQRQALADAALGQSAVRDAPCVFVLTGVVERTARKYGSRAPRFVAMEAGHVAQNLLLQAEALGLGAVPIGGFDDAAVRAVLGLPAGEDPLYLVPVGRRSPAAANE
jgi:SagB-type dehydrogenase family enzyme